MTGTSGSGPTIIGWITCRGTICGGTGLHLSPFFLFQIGFPLPPRGFLFPVFQLRPDLFQAAAAVAVIVPQGARRRIPSVPVVGSASKRPERGEVVDTPGGLASLGGIGEEVVDG